MTGSPLATISAALRHSGIGTYRIEDEKLLKTGGPNRDSQAWSGIAIRLDRGEAYVVELELTLDRHNAETAEEAQNDLRRHFEEATTEPFEISDASVDPIWGHWRCTVSRRCHCVDETVALVWAMLQWGF
ncbi:MAG: hypothetical protein ABIK09_11640 [Pseudomonadota bacterium]